MGFVEPLRVINQNSLGHSQSWRFKKNRKSTIIMTNNFYKYSLLLFFYICTLLLLLTHKLKLCQF